MWDKYYGPAPHRLDEPAFEKYAHGVGAVNAATILFSCCDTLFVLKLNYSSDKMYISEKELKLMIRIANCLAFVKILINLS
jgi:hypothetical protein